MKRMIGLIACILFGLSGNVVAETRQDFQLSTHILDINRGLPASGISVYLFKLNRQTEIFEQVGSARTNENGRFENFLPLDSNNEGIYKIKFETLPYFEEQHIESIYPYIEVVFKIEDKGHYHIPITVSANGYSTYRGS